MVDVGTGPFALFPVVASLAGTDKVYAMEAVPEVAKLARESVSKLGFNETVVEMYEGPSTSFSLDESNKADLLVAEVVGWWPRKRACSPPSWT